MASGGFNDVRQYPCCAESVGEIAQITPLGEGNLLVLTKANKLYWGYVTCGNILSLDPVTIRVRK